uniref:Helicase ATP-binding domain-containing protein n=1 Tax=Mycena chlorophos TaxID=658473 RepID=A0ABQ0LNV1_MYCCL|nr:predicted protein [Mycena chlorophos]
MTAKFTEQFGNEPYSWQLDPAEAFLLELDVLVLAGTGAGKTFSFLLPLLTSPRRWVLILSPLKVLQEDQRRRFHKMGINALVVNGGTWNAELEKILAVTG